MSETPQYAIEATNTSLEILEALVDADGPLGVTALSERIGIAKSAAHNHLSTLRANDYVIKRDGKYEPSLRPLAMGSRTRTRMDIYRARAKVDNLAEATGETALLYAMEDGHGVPVYIARSGDSWAPPFHEGDRTDLHVTAPGKAILSSLSADRVETILGDEELSAATDRTITDPVELRQQLDRIRDDGVAFSKEEHFDGIVGVAAIIPTTTGTRPAAIGVSGPLETLHGRHLEEDITGQVLSTTKSVHVDLTGL